MIDTGLKDKVVGITRANRGIGAATALALSAQRTKIFIAYLGEPPVAGLVLQIERFAELSAFQCDLADPSVPARVFDRAEGRFGGVDILINNAAHGIGDIFIPSQNSRDWGGRPTMFTDASSIDRHFAVNVRAAALLIAEFARCHLARGAKWGRIVSLTTGGAECFPGEVSYGASQNALESYTRPAGKELARFGVTANLIAPGATQTGWITPALEKIILPNVPAGRIGQPEDIADAIVLLASQQARWINCATVFVDGGQGRSN